MLNGKEREIQRRERLFVDVARKILLEEGYPAVSVSRVGELTGFSRGTVYLQFGSKEELITALGLQCRRRLVSVVERAAGFEGCPRERMLAIGEAIGQYMGLYPDDQRILKIIDSELILSRVKDERRAEMNDYDLRMFRVVLEIINEAVRVGDLVFREGAMPAGLCLAFWMMMDGALAAGMGGAPLADVGIADPVAEAVRTGQYLLDGYGWRPLSQEWDYESVVKRVQVHLNHAFGAGNGDEHSVFYSLYQATTKEEMSDV